MITLRCGKRTVLVSVAVCFLIIAGCERNSTFETSVTFKGYAYLAHAGADGTAVIDGPATGARVNCDTTNQAASIGSGGSYSLTAKSVRRFENPYADTYSLTAFTQDGRSQTITVTGKPGDTITVKSFILVPPKAGQ